jgi:hypothetical protein
MTESRYYILHAGDCNKWNRVLPPCRSIFGSHEFMSIAAAHNKSENQYGFGKFMCQINGADMTLGLIASDSCKILSFPHLIDEKVLQAIALAMAKTRQTLVLALPEKPPRSWPVLRSELSLTLARQLTWT